MSSRHRELIAQSSTPDGEALTLARQGDEYVVRVRGETLMSSRQSGSEQAMAKLACDDRFTQSEQQVLVGGLGMGFTVRAILDLAAAHARIHVVELFADVVAWNKDVLAPFAGQPLMDPRVNVVVGDLLVELARYRDAGQRFDAVLLDIDNGPEAFTVAANERLYDAQGLQLIHDALRPGGVMVLWSAFRSKPFEKRLRAAGFAARCVNTRARADVGKGARHILFVAVRRSA